MSAEKKVNNNRNNMRVEKRDGRLEPVSFDKILRRLQLLATGRNKDGSSFGSELELDVTPLSQKVIGQIKDGITTIELDEFAASSCASMVLEHPDFASLAGRIIVSNHHKNTMVGLTGTVKLLYENKDAHGVSSPLVDPATYKVFIENQDFFNRIIDYNRDFLIDYFGFKTLERSYLLKTTLGHKKIQERPQHMYMRVAVGIHGNDLQAVEETYHLLSTQKLSHASPTLFNAGTARPQLSSCFLLGMDDSLDGIYSSLKKCAMISKHAGGLGVWVSDVRAKGSRIHGTNGESDGLIPMLRVFNETARYVNQGGKRKGSIAVYLEPHHADIEAFLDLRKTHGDQSQRTLDLFLALWISDLFMERVQKGLFDKKVFDSVKGKEVLVEDKTVMWSLFCPAEAPGLSDVYGQEYQELYEKYEREGKYKKQVPVVDIWHRIMSSQMETGLPYMLYKDCVNYRNQQQNIGVVKSSNLCAEIVLVNRPEDETISVCNLCAVPLGSFVVEENGLKGQSDGKSDGKCRFDFEALGNSVRVGIQNLNKVIDINFYPVEDCAKSNYRDRPVGLGVIGLQDVFFKMRMPFESVKARKLNQEIFECIYYHAVKTSCQLAEKHGSYQLFDGSPASQGLLQLDLWNQDRQRVGLSGAELSGRYDWDDLRKQVMAHGLRNSTLVALMPTASSAQIIGQTESFEAITMNLYVRRVLSGDFKLINRYLHRDLFDLGLWTPEMREKLIANRGSIQGIEEIPEELRQLYKGAYEIKQKAMLNQAIDRSPFVDQTMSQNIFVTNPSEAILTNIQMYAWKNRLKTGQYYLRQQTTAKAAQFVIAPKLTGKKTVESSAKKEEAGSKLCLLTDPDCASCQV